MSQRHLILGTAGHIDHGKTTLIRALTGIDCDRLPEEKKRGITIDIGFAHMDLGRFRLGIIDVPGHERFIKNMLAGSSSIDVALLVIAADDSVMPQTREHLEILTSLGVRYGLVVLSKCDRVDTDWCDLVEDDVRALICGTFLENSPIVRTAIQTEPSNSGIDDLRRAISSICEQVEEPTRNMFFRLPIDRAFTVQGRGSVVTGTVWSGKLTTGDEIEWMPNGDTVTVRRIENHGRPTNSVTCGERAAINLTGAHHREIARGQELSTRGYLRPSKSLIADLKAHRDCPWPIKHRSRVRLYLGTQEIMATIGLLQSAPIGPGERGLVQLHCAEGALAIANQSFVIRAESPLRTLGGGTVLLPWAVRVNKRQTDQITRLIALRAASEIERAETAIYFYGLRSWTEFDLCRDAGIDLVRCRSVIADLHAAGKVLKFSLKAQKVLQVHRDVIHESELRMLRVLERVHREAPLRAMITRERIVGACLEWLDAQLSDVLLDRLIDRGDVRGDKRAVSLSSFVPKLTLAQERFRSGVISALYNQASKPSELPELTQALAFDEAQGRQIVELCAAQGELVHLSNDLFLHAQVESEVRRRLKSELADGRGVTVSQIRELLDTNRKVAVVLCEYLDRVGFTRREGDLRFLR